MQKDVWVTVIGKVVKPNKNKVLALNKCLEDYFKLVEWYLSFNSTSKTSLHKNCYEEAKRQFNLHTALIQTAKDKTVEILRSFNKRKKDGKAKADKPKLKRVSIRFDRRCFSFVKTTNKLTPYWLTLSLNRRERGEKIALPIKFGERQQKLIDEALSGKWQFCTVEMVKRSGEWYAHFALKKRMKLIDGDETVIGVDLGEWNTAVAVAISVKNPSKPVKGQFWSGTKIREIRGKYAHIRRSLQRKKRLDLVKKIGHRENRLVNQQLHTIAKEIVTYARQFPKPVMAMEKLNGIRDSINGPAELNRRLHSWSFQKLQQYIEYKVNLEGIPVVYVSPKNTSRRCHRCGHVARIGSREFKCLECGLVYNRDLNSAINIAHALMRGMGWGSCEPPELPDEVLARSQHGMGETSSLKAG